VGRDKSLLRPVVPAQAGTHRAAGTAFAGVTTTAIFI
jgi:hypothetical protein